MDSKKSIIVCLLLTSLLAGGCAGPSGKAEPQGPAAGAGFDAGLAHKVSNTAKTVPGVTDAAAVVMDREIVTAVRVTGFDRLRLKSIRTEACNRIKAGNPGFRVEITTDKKLFVQLQTLAQQIAGGGFSPGQVQREVEKIKKEMA